MAEIINLNRVRKAKAKASDAERAKANRALHGLTKAERQAARMEEERKARLLDQTRRED